ncbi:MAG TPA: energy transducer TonB [Spirochaetota bacterium]|nr:energy transducer TonB [Spirochaetota bacterium]
MKIVMLSGLACIIMFTGCVTNSINTSGIDTDDEVKNERYLFSFNGDTVPGFETDFDINNYYPDEARKYGIKEYTVVVLARIDEKGVLRSSKVISGPEKYGFNDAALRVIRNARFTPGYKNNEPVKMTHAFQIKFVMGNGK